MTDVFEAKFAQALKNSGCRKYCQEWIICQKLLTIESFGDAVPNEDQIAAEVTSVAKAEGVKSETVGVRT